VLGSIFAGAVHDYFAGMLSLRHEGESLPEIIGNDNPERSIQTFRRQFRQQSRRTGHKNRTDQNHQDIFMIQFLNIAGLGPIFGAIMGAKFGSSSYLWIVL